MCRQLYNHHSCGHALFVRTKTCGKKQYCPKISREPVQIGHMCDHCAANILLSMKRGGRGYGYGYGYGYGHEYGYENGYGYGYIRM